MSCGSACWSNVRPAHREILILKRQGLPLAEIAARTGLHEGSIRRILYDLARRLAIPRRTAPRSSGCDSSRRIERMPSPPSDSAWLDGADRDFPNRRTRDLERAE